MYTLISMIAVFIALVGILITVFIALNHIGNPAPASSKQPSAIVSMGISIGLSIGVAIGVITGFILEKIPLFLGIGASTSLVISIFVCAVLTRQGKLD